jgi:hypothetical protein
MVVAEEHMEELRERIQTAGLRLESKQSPPL